MFEQTFDKKLPKAIAHLLLGNKVLVDIRSNDEYFYRCLVIEILINCRGRIDSDSTLTCEDQDSKTHTVELCPENIDNFWLEL